MFQNSFPTSHDADASVAPRRGPYLRQPGVETPGYRQASLRDGNGLPGVVVFAPASTEPPPDDVAVPSRPVVQRIRHHAAGGPAVEFADGFGDVELGPLDGFGDGES